MGLFNLQKDLLRIFKCVIGCYEKKKKNFFVSLANTVKRTQA